MLYLFRLPSDAILNHINAHKKTTSGDVIRFYFGAALVDLFVSVAYVCILSNREHIQHVSFDPEVILK